MPAVVPPPRAAAPPPRAAAQPVQNPLFGKVWGMLGLRGAVPPVYSGTSVPGQLGEQGWYDRGVHLDPRVVKGLQNFPLAPSRERDWKALNVLAHEMAHVGQPRVTDPSAFREAGATMFANRLMPHLAQALMGTRATVPLPWYAYSQNYQPEIGQLFRQLGAGAPSFLQRGQFGRR